MTRVGSRKVGRKVGRDYVNPLKKVDLRAFCTCDSPFASVDGPTWMILSDFLKMHNEKVNMVIFAADLTAYVFVGVFLSHCKSLQ